MIQSIIINVIIVVTLVSIWQMFYAAYNNNNLGTEVYGLKTSNVDYNFG